MFKNPFSSEVRATKKLNALQAEINQELALAQKAQLRIAFLNREYDSIHAKFFNAEIVEVEAKKQETKIETKTQEVQKSVTCFISKEATKQNRLAIINMAKKQNVEIEIVASHGKDNYVKPTKTQNADSFNEWINTNQIKLVNYGVKMATWQRKYNKGGKTL